ncbi:MAG: hypothetical protein SRB1_01252 [Desulfobacteraceae bacterium Eth-SRB1]|uniref:Uncharacterized protein n=1 Tax=Candidatus Argoarchaeum ethanivorans TaxID=2608793 RepID=A0A8B3S055_9EURY|nr:MAG: hypothetical protein AEth_01948 [Candidatus Argoarchaeum ethanivorans]RZB32959.1 MAG: hypothetical protein SRB1_01252 [Desulfobacteraceae bacterium Eth-SRB1]
MSKGKMNKEEAKQRIRELAQRFRYNLDVYKERDKELYERQIKIVDAQIDGLVYELYGRTEKEMKVVGG